MAASRIYFIDNLRVLVNFLIVINHAIWSLTAYHFLGPADRLLVDQWRNFSMHLAPARVPFFFVISAFFAVALLQRAGLVGFALNRLRRILLPLLVGGFSFVWLVVVLATYNDASLLFNGARYWHYVRSGFAGFSYLWFLWVLMLYSAVLLLGAALLEGTVAGRRLQPPLRRACEWVLINRYSFIGIFIALELASFAGVRLLDRFALPDWSLLPVDSLVRNGGYFGMGVILGVAYQHFSERMVFRLREVLALLAVYVALGYLGHVVGQYWAFISYSIISNALPLVLLLTIFQRWFNVKWATGRYIASRSYAIYLYHLPIIASLHYGLNGAGMDPLVAFFVVLVMAYPLSLLFAEGMARFLHFLGGFKFSG